MSHMLCCCRINEPLVIRFHCRDKCNMLSFIVPIVIERTISYDVTSLLALKANNSVFFSISSWSRGILVGYPMLVCNFVAIFETHVDGL